MGCDAIFMELKNKQNQRICCLTARNWYNYVVKKRSNTDKPKLSRGINPERGNLSGSQRDT